jgi:hypothetical protein
VSHAESQPAVVVLADRELGVDVGEPSGEKPGDEAGEIGG